MTLNVQNIQNQTYERTYEQNKTLMITATQVSCIDFTIIRTQNFHTNALEFLMYSKFK